MIATAHVDAQRAPPPVGAAGSRLEVLSVAAPESGKGAQIIEGDAAQSAKKLVELLRREARVL